MICPNCNSSIPDGSQYCNHCGVSQDNPTAATAQAAKKRVVLAAGVAVLLVGLVGVLVFQFQSNVGETGPVQNPVNSTAEINARDQYRVTMDRIQRLGAAIEVYRSRQGRVPRVSTVNQLNSSWFVPEYINTVPVRDAWGNELIYRYHGNEAFYICSSGNDGLFASINQRGRYHDLMSGKDIILYSADSSQPGEFVFAPRW